MSEKVEDSLRDRRARLLGKTIFGATLIVVALTAIPYGTVDSWWESLFEAAVFLIVILWMIEAAINRSESGEESRLLYPLFAIAGFACLQSITFRHSPGGAAMADTLLGHALSADPFETWRFAFKLLAVTCVFGLLLHHTSNAARLRSLVYLIVFIAVGSALFGLLRTVWPLSFFNRLIPESSFGQFENRNHFAFLMEMGIGVLLGMAVTHWRKRLRLAAYILGGLLMWTALLMTHSRGGVVSLLAEIPFFFLLYSIIKGAAHSNRRDISSRSLSPLKKVVMAGCLLAMVAASVVIVGGDETIYRLRSTPKEFAARDVGPPRVDRPQIWQATLKLIRDNPVIGIGFAAYPLSISKYLDASGEFTPQAAHNDYLEVLASGGIVAAVLFAWFLILCFRQIRARLQLHDSNLAVRCGAGAGLFAVGVHSLFDFGLHVTVNALTCAALLVVAVIGMAEKPAAI